ncbi:MAG TPA: hypothetical protein VJU16_04740 [Planctomycetota bacterium]|nr:hypothetical protein [Planctomycetota bacterium]
MHAPMEPRRKVLHAPEPPEGPPAPKGSITPGARERIRLSLERRGYRIFKPRIPILWINQSNNIYSLAEGRSSLGGENVMAIMAGPDGFLVITPSRGGKEGDPYLFGLDQAEELR